jgi:hypothetical protein
VDLLKKGKSLGSGLLRNRRLGGPFPPGIKFRETLFQSQGFRTSKRSPQATHMPDPLYPKRNNLFPQVVILIRAVSTGLVAGVSCFRINFGLPHENPELSDYIF